MFERDKNNSYNKILRERRIRRPYLLGQFGSGIDRKSIYVHPRRVRTFECGICCWIMLSPSLRKVMLRHADDAVLSVEHYDCATAATGPNGGRRR